MSSGLRLVLPPTGPWKRSKTIVPKNFFGAGAKKDFAWYFEGKSKVEVKNAQEACKWLTRCKYISDKELFMEDDFWQHPITFENIRQGDCDDHALWIWRKLNELGYICELVVGKFTRQDLEHRRNIRGSLTGHAWVIYKEKVKDKWFLIETTEKNPQHMIMTAEESKDIYLPEYSIDGALQTYKFLKI
jgi:hypothetical protein